MGGAMNRLKDLRKSLNLTQAQLCERLDLNINTYRTWEHGKIDLGISILSLFADFYGVTTDYIIGRSVADVYLTNDLLSDLDGLPEEALKEIALFIKFQKSNYLK